MRALLVTLTLLTLATPALAADAPAPAPAPAVAPPTATLQVYTKPIEPFSFEQDGKAMGFSIDLWDRIARKLNVGYEIHWVKSVGDLVQTLKEKKADIGIAAISVTAEREKAFDFSTPYFESGLGILVKAQGKSGWAIAKEIFWTRTVLIGFLILCGILAVLAHLLWFFERNSNGEQFPNAYVRGVWEASWWAISTILSGGCDAKGPMVVAGRIIGALWMLVCIIVLTYFTAAITTAMTVSQLTSSISGPNDLPGKKVATVSGSTAEKYCKAHGVKVVGFGKIDEAYAAFDKNEVVAVVYDQPILAYHLRIAGGADQSVVGLFERQNYAIGLPEGSAYRKAVNTALLELREEGVIEELRSKWFGEGN